MLQPSPLLLSSTALTAQNTTLLLVYIFRASFNTRIAMANGELASYHSHWEEDNGNRIGGLVLGGCYLFFLPFLSPFVCLSPFFAFCFINYPSNYHHIAGKQDKTRITISFSFDITFHISFSFLFRSLSRALHLLTCLLHIIIQFSIQYTQSINTSGAF